MRSAGANTADDRKQGAGATIWLTGLSGAGKTTLAAALCERMTRARLACEHLDGDRVRRELGEDLGFTREDREVQGRRLAFIAGLLSTHGVMVVVSAISPYREIREEARRRAHGRFIEVYVNAPLAACERRDRKGLYRDARAGRTRDFTGVHDPYEPPLSPEVECCTDRETIEQSLDKIWAAIQTGLLVGACDGR